MTTEEQSPKKSIRELMPPNFLPILVERSGLSTNTIYRAVKSENQRSRAWPFILQLAKEHQQEIEDLEKLKSAS